MTLQEEINFINESIIDAETIEEVRNVNMNKNSNRNSNNDDKHNSNQIN